MLFNEPVMDDTERSVLIAIDELRSDLRLRLHEPHRWSGSLRRTQFARVVQGSNSIEGFVASLDDTAAIDLGEEPLDADAETRLALKGYRDAMTFVLQIAGEDDFRYSDQLLKSLHFMMTGYDLKNRPGRWRSGSIFVYNDEMSEVVYTGPEVDDISGLVAELVSWLESVSSTPPMIRAAMAHLNLVMIHPFRDGNGRMARCLQTLVLCHEGVLTPTFSSIEEYLGRNTQAYYDVLARVGGGTWQPERDTRPWIRFNLTAHLRQAETLLRRISEIEQMWDRLEKLVASRNLPERTVVVLNDAAMGFRVRNATYREALKDSTGEEITEATAGRDLRQLVESDLLVARGEKRGRLYVAGPEITHLRGSIIGHRATKEDRDPFNPKA